jgi:hypothetical protein
MSGGVLFHFDDLQAHMDDAERTGRALRAGWNVGCTAFAVFGNRISALWPLS